MQTRVLLAAALGMLVVALSAPLWWRFGAADLLFVHSIAVGSSLIIGGAICARWRAGRQTARLMLLTAVLWFLPYVGYGYNSLGFTIGLVAEGVWLATAAHFIVAFPEGRLRSRAEITAVYGTYALALGLKLALLFYDPSTDCSTCPQNLLLVSAQPQVPLLAGFIGLLLQLVVTLGILFIVTRRWRHSTRPERRVLTPVFGALVLAVVVGLGSALASTLYVAGVVPVEVAGLFTFLGRTTLVLLPISFGIGMARGVLARSAVGNLMVRIGMGRNAAEIERDVAWALADPSARIALHENGQFRLLNGRPVDLVTQPAGSVHVIGGSRGEAGALITDPSLEQLQPELLDGVLSATRLALENHRLESEAALAAELPIGLAERLQRQGRSIGESTSLTISVLMSDIRGYTTIAERADARDLAAQLNEHRVQMNRVISGAGGTVMQYAGDSVFAVFGAPEPAPDHAARAVAAARAMQSAQTALNIEWTAEGRQPFGLGIGVTTGEVAAALSGSAEHVEYSVVGDVVNLAQRLQAWAKPGQTVISSETRAQAGSELEAEQLPTATVKGRTAPVTAFLLGAA